MNDTWKKNTPVKNEMSTACAFQHVHSISGGAGGVASHCHFSWLYKTERGVYVCWGGDTERHSLEVTHPVGGTVVTERRAKRRDFPVSPSAKTRNERKREKKQQEPSVCARTCTFTFTFTSCDHAHAMTVSQTDTDKFRLQFPRISSIRRLIN